MKPSYNIFIRYICFHTCLEAPQTLHNNNDDEIKKNPLPMFGLSNKDCNLIPSEFCTHIRFMGFFFLAFSLFLLLYLH